MIQFTSLAIIIISALLAKWTNLPGLLLIAGVLQAGSVFNITTSAAAVTGTNAYGLTPFQFMAPLIIVLAILKFIERPRTIWPKKLVRPIFLLSLYVIVSVVGALTLPTWFAGLMLNPAIKIYGVLELSALTPNLSNWVQAITLLMLFFVMLAFLLSVQSKSEKQKVIHGLVLASMLVVCSGAYEQIAPFYKWSSVAGFWANNPGYSQAPLAPVGFIMNRVGVPFSEPSYASAFMAAMALGSMALALLGRRWWLGMLASLICILGLINTLGSTGLAAFGVAFVCLVIWVVLNSLKSTTSFSRRIRTALLFCVMLAASTWGFNVYQESSVRPQAEAMVKALILDKAKLNDGIREKTNQRAIEILIETKGLGVGLGSHRASSFFASLLANTGILGFSLFIAMLASLLWRYWKAPALSDMQIFIAAALPTATLAMGLGIPDLNMPMYWNFIFLGFVFCPGDDAGEEVDGGGCPPARA